MIDDATFFASGTDDKTHETGAQSPGTQTTPDFCWESIFNVTDETFLQLVERGELVLLLWSLVFTKPGLTITNWIPRILNPQRML
jgi:hypothetical protein